MPDVYVRLREAGLEDGEPIPANGTVTLTPARVVDPEALVTNATTVLRVAGGVADPVAVSAGRWRVDARSRSWQKSWTVDLEDDASPINLALLVPVDPSSPLPWLPTEDDLLFIRETRERIPDLIEAAVAEGDYTGPAGRGVASIADDDGDGTATVTYSDGETAPLPLPPGPPGTDGVSPPPPEIAWDGSHLVVGGERSPDLTGPAGPAPDVAWDGPVLVVGGVSGPDLTGPEGPASTVPGPPGAVPTAADYMVVGPGRPDAPTATGMTAAALNALPVGAEYRSTDGASVGAWVWRKRPDGSWDVIDGDTGWRDVRAELLPSITSGRLLIRRIGPTVHLQVEIPNLAHTDVALPNGFRSDTPARVAHPLIRANGLTGYVDPIGSNLLIRADHASAIAENRGGATWATTDPWPSTLPGAPA